LGGRSRPTTKRVQSASYLSRFKAYLRSEGRKRNYGNYD
jgi:hypothetical protein